MVLDKLYFTMRHAKYPICNRRELVNALGDILVHIENEFLTAEDIANLITHYPIHNVAEFFHKFIKKESDKHDLNEYELVSNFESEAEMIY